MVFLWKWLTKPPRNAQGPKSRCVFVLMCFVRDGPQCPVFTGSFFLPKPPSGCDAFARWCACQSCKQRNEKSKGSSFVPSQTSNKVRWCQCDHQKPTVSKQHRRSFCILQSEKRGLKISQFPQIKTSQNEFFSPENIFPTPFPSFFPSKLPHISCLQSLFMLLFVNVRLRWNLVHW